jgi:hypothetical protein
MLARQALQLLPYSFLGDRVSCSGQALSLLIAAS